jgi:hypothetical protein
MSVKYLPVVAVVALLSACTTQVSVHKVRGQEALEVDCSGLGSSWKKCYKQAEKSCRPYGYRELGKSSDYQDDPADGFLGWTPGQYTRTLMLRCNTAPSA